MNRRQILTTFGIGTIAMSFGHISAFSGSASQKKFAPWAAYGAEDTKPQKEIIEMISGKDDAPITVIEYASFTCPYCRTFHMQVYPQLKRNYMDTGLVRFILREVYFDRYGLWGSILARCDNNQARFFTIYDRLMQQQKSWTQGSPQQVIESLQRIGRAAGLSEDQITACFSDAEGAKMLVDWASVNLEKDDINGTPAFVINGKNYANMNYENFSRILDEKIDKAKLAQ